MNKATQRKTLEIAKDFESTPERGNSTDEMIARTEYVLAKRMLSGSGPIPPLLHTSDAETKMALVGPALKGEGQWDSFFIGSPSVSDDLKK